MKRLLFILQILLKLLLVFSIAFIWLRFLVDSLLLAIAFSCGITILFELLHRLIQKRTKSRENLKLKEKEDAENMFFSMLTNSNYIDFYQEMLKTRYSSVISKKDYLVVNKNEQKIVLYPFIKLEVLKPSNLLEILRKTNLKKTDKLIILCYDFDKETSTFIKNFSQEIYLADRFQCYSLYKEYEFFPEITQEYKKEAKPTFKDLLGFAFNRSRTKGYIFSSLILFLASFFVKINIYYCIISSLLLLFALISYINPKYNKPLTQEVI